MWTHTDEAPALASYALLPLVSRFAKSAGITVKNADISVSARILAQFPDRLSDAQRVPDTLAELGVLATTPACNIIKLPNVSASIPQLNEAIAELQAKGYPVPNYNQTPSTAEEKEVTARYAKVLGSAVNPVLREGNSDRRVAAPVKAYAAKNPHKMGKWSADSKTHVATMTEGDFYGSEQSATVAAASDVRIELVPAAGGAPVVLKASTKLEAHEMIDASFMSIKHLKAFLSAEVADARATNTMLSAHLKATMMKISDPIIFGHVVSVFFKVGAAAFERLATVSYAEPVNEFGGDSGDNRFFAAPAETCGRLATALGIDVGDVGFALRTVLLAADIQKRGLHTWMCLERLARRGDDQNFNSGIDNDVGAAAQEEQDLRCFGGAACRTFPFETQVGRPHFFDGSGEGGSRRPLLESPRKVLPDTQRLVERRLDSMAATSSICATVKALKYW